MENRNFAPSAEGGTWTEEHSSGTKYLCTTHFDIGDVIDALSATFASDLLWWASPVGKEDMVKLLNNSMCFAVFQIGAIDGNQHLVGFGRLITDRVTFAYLTDVYVVPGHQGKGVGRWMMGCVNEILDFWPHLRGCLLLTGDPKAIKFYHETLGAEDFKKVAPGLVVLEKVGPAMKQNSHLSAA
ncbi:hypothetical protein B0T25DRAFT_258187 [Lasiosphaeria hispida]|uniref:N-acetyltransferase domain-containing protein n=1 Tax=Lasiosphaeria hispida TaxID=260671 RepID=A0AAJ0MDA0_9PEZI|nr:hypothetical protein B0T25DRAFT_258187 [Lasiosphaeria hispida]